MATYSPIAMDHFLSPRNSGPLEDYDLEGNARLPGQSPFMRLHLCLAGQIVERATFMTFGCAAAVASGSMLTEMITGKTIAQCQEIDSQVLDIALGGLPNERKFCTELAIAALRNAIAQLV